MFPDVYCFPDPSVHPVAFSVDHPGMVPVYDVVQRDTWWTVVPTKAAVVAETSTKTMNTKVVFG